MRVGQPVPMYNWIAFAGFAVYSVYAQTNGLQGNIGELRLSYRNGMTALMTRV